MINFELQPSLENDLIKLQTLKPEDFETLYLIASDPLIWEQHPNKDRYERSVFETFFKGAIESEAAFLVFDKQIGKPIGSSRFYEFDLETSSIAIGYTFLAKDYWGGMYNRSLKTLMLNYAFQYVEQAVFHIGAYNIRSQRAIEKLGAKKVEEIEMAYYGEATKLNFVYRIKKKEWLNRAELVQ